MPGRPRNVENVRNHSAMPAVTPSTSAMITEAAGLAEQVLAHGRVVEHDGVPHALELGEVPDHVEDVVEVGGPGISDRRAHHAAQ